MIIINIIITIAKHRTRSVSSAWRAAICERATGWVQPRSAPRTRAYLCVYIYIYIYVRVYYYYYYYYYHYYDYYYYYYYYY